MNSDQRNDQKDEVSQPTFRDIMSQVGPVPLARGVDRTPHRCAPPDPETFEGLHWRCPRCLQQMELRTVALWFPHD